MNGGVSSGTVCSGLEDIYHRTIVVFHTGDGWGMQGGAPNGLGGGANSGMSGPPMGGNNQGNQGNMGGNKTTTQVTIPKDVSRIKKNRIAH